MLTGGRHAPRAGLPRIR